MLLLSGVAGEAGGGEEGGQTESLHITNNERAMACTLLYCDLFINALTAFPMRVARKISTESVPDA